MKPPKILYVNPSGTSTEAGLGFVGFADQEVGCLDILNDRKAGMKSQAVLWVYELLAVDRVVVSVKKGGAR